MQSTDDKRVSVGRGGRKYAVVFKGVEQLADSLEEHCRNATQVCVFVDERVLQLHGRTLRRTLKSLDRPVAVLPVSRGERTKSPQKLLACVDLLLSHNIDRDALVIAIGGGVTTDLVGCAASLCLRGIKWIAVPTTFLGQVDAAIGGKTGVNSRRGKNLIGAFWPPQEVIICPEIALTQSPKEFRSGLSEAAKYYAISGRPSIRRMAELLDSFPDCDIHRLTEVIFDCARYKARIVTKDEKEAGVRVHLNFGHTIGHALEKSVSFSGLTHGRAVAAGMIGALWLSERCGMEVDHRLTVLKSFTKDLARGKSNAIDPRAVIEHLDYDKKRRDGVLKFVLLKGIGKPYTCEVGDRLLIRESIKMSLHALRGRLN